MLLSLLFLVTCLPSALAADLNVDAGFYFKQSRGGTCTLASAAMMLRRRAYLDGMGDWVDVTENSVRSSAWVNGLSHNFTYNAMQVGYATLPSSQEEKKQVLIQLLEEHPEGIVIYDRTKPHAVLLTDYTDGVFYCSDPANNISAGRVPISQSSVSISRVSCYWYICSDSNSLSSSADTLRLEGMRYPVNVCTGKGITLNGLACSGTDALLTEVEIVILDAAGEPVQSAQAAPNAAVWSFRELDSQIRFGQLEPGAYTYMVVLSDTTGKTLCFASDFTVSGSAADSECYWSAQDTGEQKLLHQVQDTARELADPASAAPDMFDWLSEIFSW
ncbi:MAG: hypothetical protein ACI4JC_07610 [Faecalibacterium sp.]